MFKEGDIIVRNRYDHGKFNVGDICKISKVESQSSIILEGDYDRFTHSGESLRLATDEERDEYWSGLTKGTEVLLRRDSGDEVVLVIDYEQDNIYFFTNGDAYYKYKIRKIMNKKIVGYRIKKGCEIYIPSVKLITSLLVLDPSHKGYEIYEGGGAVEPLKKAGVLDLWFEPVYEDEPIIIGGTYKVEFVGGYFKINGTSYQKTDLILVKNVLELTAVQSINVGCSGQYQIDLTTVNKILSRL